MTNRYGELGQKPSVNVARRLEINGTVLTRHMVYGHGVLADHALPVLVGELFQVFATGNGPGVEPGAEPFHGGRLANGHGGLYALPQHPYVIRVREVIVINQRVLVRVLAAEQQPAPALGPQKHWEHAEHVLAVQVAQVLVVKVVAQTVSLFRRRAAVRVGRRGRQHELDVGPVVRLIAVLGRDERHRLQAHVRSQRAVAQHRVPVQHTIGTVRNAFFFPKARRHFFFVLCRIPLDIRIVIVLGLGT